MITGDYVYNVKNKYTALVTFTDPIGEWTQVILETGTIISALTKAFITLDRKPEWWPENVSRAKRPGDK
jgi:hypothetical protein